MLSETERLTLKDKRYLLSSAWTKPDPGINEEEDKVRREAVFYEHEDTEYQKLPLILPHLSSPVYFERFFQLPNLFTLWSCGRINFDMYASWGMLIITSDGNPADFERDLKIDVEEKFPDYVIEAHKLRRSLKKNLERISRSVRGDKSTIDALHVIHNTANLGKRIAFVAAHGGTSEYYKEGEKKKGWCVVNRGVITPVNDLVSQIAKKREEDGKLRYGLVYINSCNSKNELLDMGTKEDPVPIPVVSHSVTNSLLNASARVNWPPYLNK